jgi:flavin reductase (DIM6/NTAB) family NADH-FMN oxidoreductase RutF
MMEKILVGKTSVGATPVVIAGALVKGKPNYLTLGNYGTICPSPATVYISIKKARYTNAGIKESGYFSVNIPSKKLVKKTDYVGLVSGKDTDKSDVFSAFYGIVDKAPMIGECPVNILCKLINTIDMPTGEVFIGEIVETYVNKECMTNGASDLKKINPLLLGGGSYWELGNKAGSAFRAGKALIKK